MYVIVPLDREAARRRLAEKRRRNTALRLSAELRAAAAQSPQLANLLTAIATEMDDYLDTHVQATGTSKDPATWRAAITLARAILGEVTE